MRTSTLLSRIGAAVAVTAVLAAAGCGNEPAAKGDTKSAGAHTHHRKQGAAGASSTPAAKQAGGCVDDLKVTAGRTGAAAGSAVTTLVVTNGGAKPCRAGVAGAAYVDQQRTRVGAPADRMGAARTATIEPGARMTARLQQADAANYPRAKCRPTPVAGVRVRLVGGQHATVLPRRATGCAGTTVHLLHLG